MTVVWSCGCGRRVLTVDARYDAVADFYAAGWPDSGDDPVALALLSLSGDVAGEQILDLACGHGRITRQLAGRGASVTGIDISAALIAKAIDAERCQPGGIRYLQADAAAADWLPGHAVRRSRLQLRAIRHRRFGRRSRCRRPVRLLDPAPLLPGGQDVSGAWPATGSYYDEGWWRAAGAASRSGGRSGRTTGPCPPTSTRCGSTAYGWTLSSSQPRHPNGRALGQTPPACPSSW